MIGIDPGVATGGMVLVDEHGVVAAASIGAKAVNISPWPGDAVFGATLARSEMVVRTVLSTLGDWEGLWGRPDRIAVESFVDLPSRAAHRGSNGEVLWVKDRWKTPLVIGLLHAYLSPYDIAYQNPSVLASYRGELVALKERRSDVSGAHLLTNAHMRTAWCHADEALARLGLNG